LPPGIDPRDKEIALEENRAYMSSLFESMTDSAVWVNSLAGRRRANSKLSQLKEAQNLGIQIPETLISNDPQEIKEFLDPKWGPSVVKPLFGGDWTEDGSRIFTYTAGISISDLPSDDMIKACPCIYQRKIKKQFEARVAFFGAHTISVKLDSQRDKISELDWRVGDTRALNVEEISIPIALKEKCLLLMRRLGILHGSFDFAIDDEDNWIFFEVNEQGQFLWMETYVPHLPVLDTAIHFLMEPTVDFIYHPQASPVKMREICRLERFRSLIKMEKEIEKIYQNAESILL
jgi:glutathione synthase/RimK-type ligase-like ATP-grasp enzyme